MKSKIYLVALTIIGVVTFNSCETDDMTRYSNDQSQLKSTLFEDFEDGSKSSYSEAEVSLGSGTWNFDEALLGTLSSDDKYDDKSVRVRNSGILTMKFDKSDGAETFSIYHSKYNNDGSSTWELWMSVNSGSSWTQVGSTITTSSTSLTYQSFTVNQSGSVRFEIRKVSGDSDRINFDNMNISDYSSDDDTDSGDGGSAEDDDDMLLGNPSDATADIVNDDNYLMIKDYFSISYSNENLTPNWVSWHLDSDDFGSADRQDDYRADEDLPSDWIQVSTSDYTGSGFNRGHMCPSADRKSTVDANSATFLMTNMIPQSPNNNQVVWGDLETYSRSLVDDGNELFIISGTYGQGGTGSYGYESTIGDDDIVVPSYVWKVIVVLEDGDDDLSRINSSSRVIAVFMPNNQTVSDYDWDYYRVSVDYLENLTGYDFLSNVSTSIQSSLESDVDDGATV